MADETKHRIVLEVDDDSDLTVRHVHVSVASLFLGIPTLLLAYYFLFAVNPLRDALVHWLMK